MMLILINQWLLNLIVSMTKTLNGQNSSSQNFYPTFPPFPPFKAISKTWHNQCMFSSLIPSFLFQTFQISSDPTPVVIS